MNSSTATLNKEIKVDKFSADFKTAQGEIKSLYLGTFKSFNDAVKAANRESLVNENKLVGVRLRIYGEFAPYLKD